MMLGLPISFIVCFSIGLLLSGTLGYNDIKCFRAETGWERIFWLLLDISEASFLVGGIITAVIMLHGHYQQWQDATLLYILQFVTGANVRVLI